MGAAKEIRTPMKPIKVEAQCPCGKGTQVGTSSASKDEKGVIQFDHKCSHDKCKITAQYPKRYPALEYEPLEE